MICRKQEKEYSTSKDPNAGEIFQSKLPFGIRQATGAGMDLTKWVISLFNGTANYENGQSNKDLQLGLDG